MSPKRIEKELGPDIGQIRLRLGDQQATFDGGTWIPESGKIAGTFKENEKLKKDIKKLEEENNLLKLKYNLILDMITEKTAEIQLQQSEIDNLCNKLSLKKKYTT